MPASASSEGWGGVEGKAGGVPQCLRRWCGTVAVEATTVVVVPFRDGDRRVVVVHKLPWNRAERHY